MAFYILFFASAAFSAAAVQSAQQRPLSLTEISGEGQVAPRKQIAGTQFLQPNLPEDTTSEVKMRSFTWVAGMFTRLLIASVVAIVLLFTPFGRSMLIFAGLLQPDLDDVSTTFKVKTSGTALEWLVTNPLVQEAAAVLGIVLPAPIDHTGSEMHQLISEGDGDSEDEAELKVDLQHCSRRIVNGGSVHHEDEFNPETPGMEGAVCNQEIDMRNAFQAPIMSAVTGSANSVADDFFDDFDEF
eukprot:gnl/MRDRNA2_/MRDRNA2_132050_c0_seq1.p1 gnl/MRDRNA2_/MRDRNA2_132050_c0~~gnl/MRDRNA2_/MRDRNA2_132050_c0_seq1.p1  ORF type:complete len:242 (-),score=55.97 gnl/MRDRNA2_/MRDRNA2_132050_c0_seq1:10-735(-)